VEKEKPVASIIMAAGRGSRMKGYDGNKTLLPLIPERGPFDGHWPILKNILNNLPTGPKCIIVRHKKDQVMEASKGHRISYCEQKILNGTGGALLAAKPFLNQVTCDRIIITMGDVPLVKKQTYLNLISRLEAYHMVVLGFRPDSKRQYGLIELEKDRVTRIIEWKYWKEYPKAKQSRLQICNSGIYAARRQDLLVHLQDLASMPHRVSKEICGKWQTIEEFFITDLVEILNTKGKKVGYELVANPQEVMGVDDPLALAKAQRLFATGAFGKPN